MTEGDSPLYDQEDIQEILQLAIAKQSQTQLDQEEMTQAQLWAIAEELGIDQNTITTVEEDWREQQLVQQKRREFDLYRREVFQQKLARFTIVNLFLMAINLLGAHQLSWSLYIVLIWGIFIALNAWKTFQTDGELYEQAYLSWDRKVQLKESVQTLWEKIQGFLRS